MKLYFKLRAGSHTSEHKLHFFWLPSDAQRRQKAVRFVLDDKMSEALAEEISPGVYSILLNGRSYEAVVTKQAGDPPGLESPHVVTVGLRHYLVEARDVRHWRRGSSRVDAEGPQEILAPMPGKIAKILVQENQEVGRDQGLMVIEAMKMQNELRAPRGGHVEKIYVQEGLGVEAGTRLVRLG